jgi:hypothetical protein
MRRFDQRWLLLAIPVLLGAGIAGVSLFPTASNQGYAPEQPIPFSHKLHAGQYKMACQYCHSSVEKSKHASVPSVNVCMNCHTVVKTDSPHIQKIHQAWKSGKPIEWVRVHELPDHAVFSHKRHVGVGLACQTCHGPVQEMEKVYQASALTMGWCMECHRGTTTPKQVLARVQGKNPSLPPGHAAAQQCNTCHN